MEQQKKALTGRIAEQTGISPKSVEGVVDLLHQGATIPFISRYRKEATGGLDEVGVGTVKTAYEKLTELLARRQTILDTIEGQGKLTEELRARIENCFDAPALEDIYLPYKPKRRTRATIARERGLEPLTAIIMRQDGADPAKIALRYVTGEVPDTTAALEGACDIVAEWVSESERSRVAMRRLFSQEGMIVSKAVKGKEETGANYADYFDYSGPLRRVPSHRLMAMVRGEKEGVLRLSVAPDEGRALEMLDRIFIRGTSPSRKLVEASVADSYKRLLRPSMESEMMSLAREKADAEAIRVFAGNLRQLLLAAPLGEKRLMAIDPGFRTGCKVVCLDSHGMLLHNDTIYPHPPQNRRSEAIDTLLSLASRFSVEAVAVGDGTAGRETLALVREAGLTAGVQVYMVSEDGASVYSASDVAREEFPDKDVTVRGAVSIGRRLMDPLAELVKIDPKSIGVGQYQHDVDQGELKRSLDRVVESCVNSVGVNLNTASRHILSHVSGLGPVLAANIVDYRTANGAFRSRAELRRVPRLGAKAFEQCAGFLRIAGAENPLDNSAVHPESYPVAERMAKDLGVSLARLLADKELQKKIVPGNYITPAAGLPTINDILSELDKPSADPRTAPDEFDFDPTVHSIDDLRPGMRLPGVVTNITAFGAFVDIGVKQDGLVHISQLADRYVSSPADVVHLGQKVWATVLDIDRPRSRISLSLKQG